MEGDIIKEAKKPEVENIESVDQSKTTDNDEEVDIGDLTDLSLESRNQLFQRGLAFEKSGKKHCALKCYLGCLTDLHSESCFVLLPQCLRNIADIYFLKEEYEKAILFIQAEKLYYENALIDTTEIQNTLEKLRQNQGVGSNNENSVRAEEYETLARLCMDQKQPHLALEYAGKATKIRQQIFGNDHQITKDSLDYFATLYAEVGRKQYSDSMTQLSSPSSQDSRESSQNMSPTSILRRQTSVDSSEEREKKSVRFGEPIETRRLIYDDNIPRSFTVLLMLFGFIVTLILGTWLFCIMRNDHVCHSFSAEVQYIYTKFRYFIYQSTGSKKFRNG